MDAYHYRLTSSKPVVKVYEAFFQKNSNFCSNMQNIEVKTEYIPFRLSQTRDLNHGQALYVLSEALAGFNEIHSKIGAFSINDALIGFNQYGHCKVWHTPNFAVNHFDHDSIILMSTANPHNFDERLCERQEEEMVEQIFLEVEKHSQINPGFREAVNSFQEYDFVTARRSVADEIDKHNCYVPLCLRFEDKSHIIEKSRISRSGISKSRVSDARPYRS